jgi:phenylpropionate dioxygenase-like ring-hydroxylating dioxygenase large terminal subunit
MEALETPAPAHDGVSVVHLPDQWFVACQSPDLARRPLAVTLQGTPLVLFRTADGKPGALIDRCPHRNTPLSAGRVEGGELECAYHGWRFGADGGCRAIPGLVGAPDRQARRAAAYPAVEQDGFVWVYSTPDATPTRPPPRIPHLDDSRYATIRRVFTIQAALFHALENALDVPHTAFLHAGLFRTRRDPHEIEVIVRRMADRVEAEYVGEPRPSGIVGRLLAPGGGVVVHFDRFLLPCLAQVEYRLGDDNHLVVTSAMTPVGEFETRVFAVVSLRLRVGTRLVVPLVSPLATRIFRQDMSILARQTATIRRFGGERLASTEIDVLGPQIWRLLQEAAHGTTAGTAAGHEHRVRLLV